jgi:ankyrin repeat protein
MFLEHGLSIANTAALHTAANFGHLDTMRLLIQRGADINEVIPAWNNWTPLHFAAWGDEVDAMALLEEHGTRTDLETKDGKTPAQLLKDV